MSRNVSRLSCLVGLAVFTVIVSSVDAAKAEGTIEVSCRAQAKEIAVQTYQNCVTQARTQRIQEIRKEYQAKLSDLKSTYDQELKSVAGEKATRKMKGLKSTVRGNKLPEKLIPTKKLPIRQTEESNAVVVSPHESSDAPSSPETIQEGANSDLGMDRGADSEYESR